MMAYCMKERTQREMKDPKAVTLKNGRAAMEGTCSVCGAKMVRMGTGEDTKGAAKKTTKAAPKSTAKAQPAGKSK